MIKLVCFDIDGVIFKDINFWLELHEKFGTLEKGKELTRKYLHTDYDKLVEEVVVKLWKGKDAKLYFELVNSLEYLPGIKKVFSHIKQKRYQTALISASSIEVARRIDRDFGVDHIFANELVIKNGKVSGEFIWPIGAGNEKKAEIMKHLCQDLGIDLIDVAYIGDSETDIEAFKIVGTSIAFNSKSEKLKKVAKYIIDENDLSKIIPYI